MVDFAGWSMPVQYTSIVDEHQATRRQVGLFDISHMGRIRFRGADACAYLDGIVTRRVADLKPGAIRYSLVTNDRGGILDDVLVYRLREPADEYFLVVNASNRQKILDWLAAHRTEAACDWHDETAASGMLAVQGPQAVGLVNGLLEQGAAVDSMKYYSSAAARVAGVDVLLSRTGYTGEDGCELIAPADQTASLWQTLLDAGAARGAKPAGLGARDTLRLEAGMPLYGHELSENIHPFEADLSFAVNLADRSFPGADALRTIAAQPRERQRVGLLVEGRRVPREGFAVAAADGTAIGTITSGTFSPTLDQPIAMAMVRSAQAAVNQAVQVDIRGKLEAARIVKLPFYQRPQAT